MKDADDADCNFETKAIRHETYTPTSMRQYLEGIALVKYQGWKKEEGCTRPSGLPWVSFISPERNWMHHYLLDEEGRMTKVEFDPTIKINLRRIDEVDRP